MSQELEWIRRLEAIRDKLASNEPASWMAEWRSLNRIIEEAGTVRPDIKTWAPSALQTFGDDIVPSEKVRQIAEDAIRLLKPGS